MGNFKTTRDVLLAAPQLIGYARAVLYILGFMVVDIPRALGIPGFVVCLLCYTIAFILDLFDGLVARALQQTSQLGGVLDMVVDRAATAALLTTLAGAYPDHRLWFALLVALDLASHWMHCACCQLTPTGGHHKAAKTLANKNILIRLYYGVYPFFGYCCVGTEVFYILLLGLSYAPSAALVTPVITITLEAAIWYLCFPACVFKNTVNMMQLCSATVGLAEIDAPRPADRKDS
mmetsp:Transcript_73723/g.208169  ORF Transcript_73723/g.208169 Transcript_73723/m.208169 type:complete len:234 (+) Transcript_73723:136-837(+)